MPKRLWVLVILLTAVGGGLAACGAAVAPTTHPTAVQTAPPTQAPTLPPTQVPAPEPTMTAVTPVLEAWALRITGNVEQESSWTEGQIKEMPTRDARSQDSQGVTETYTGVPIRDLLALVKPRNGATTLVFVGEDRATAEVSLAEVLSCADCILSFRKRGGFSTVLPGLSGGLQVKGVVEIQVK